LWGTYWSSFHFSLSFFFSFCFFFCGVRIGHLFSFLCFLCVLSVSFLWGTYWSSFHFPVFLCVLSVSYFLWGSYWSSFQYSVFFVCSFCFFFVGYVLVIFSKKTQENEKMTKTYPTKKKKQKEQTKDIEKWKDDQYVPHKK
jgi:hypothetical protein